MNKSPNVIRPSVSGTKRVLRIPGGKTNDEHKLKVGTWNVRSLYEAGKLTNTIQEMKRLKIDILGISETWWANYGEFKTNNTTVYYSGNQNKNHRNGVGIIVNKDIANCVIGWIPKSDRTLLLKISAKPLNINIIQAYAPTADKSEEEIEKFYEEIEELLKYTKPHEINIIQGDFNAKVGQGKVDGIVGNFGLGERNDRGDRLIEFCQKHQMNITNTCFCLPPRRLYTWKSPMDNSQNIIRNQIDYLIINKRFASTISRVSTFPGADVPSDHNLLLAQLRLKLTSVKKKIIRNPKPDIEKLKVADNKNKLTSIINTKLHALLVTPAQNVWDPLKENLNSLTRRILGTFKRQTKNGWMTEEILHLMDERRKLKNRNNDAYRILQNEIRSKIRSAKVEWLNGQCQEIEMLQNLHDNFNLHKKLKETSGIYKKPNHSFLVNENNEAVFDTNVKKRIWVRYISDAFSDSSRPNEIPLQQTVSGTPISRDEVVSALNSMKERKAAGPDEVPAEILKLIDGDNIQLLVQLFNHVYDTGNYPQDWLKSTFITLPKKNHAKHCSEYRLISLMSHSLKIFLKVIHNRIYQTCEEVMGQSQFGFRNGMGTREALFCVHLLVENCMDVQKDVFLCFIDYEKAFDNVQHEKLFNILRALHLKEKDIQVIQNLYWNQTAHIVIDGEKTNDVPISKGVRQGCILSPLLFNIYSEAIFQEVLENTEDGIKVNGVYINNIRYADDTTLISDSMEGLQRLVDSVTRQSQIYGLKINVNKTKFMSISRRNVYNNLTLTSNNMPIERVNKFKYLGRYINDTCDDSMEIKCRIEMARAAFYKYSSVLKNHNFNLNLKIRFVRCYVLSVLLYGMETWTMKVSDMNRIEAFEMWILRRILKIPWTDRVSNSEVLRRVNSERELLRCIKRRKTAYLGHICRNHKYNLLQLILQGKIEGRRGIGRKKLSWLRNIRQWIGVQNIGHLLELARNRDAFSNIIKNL